MTIKVTKWIQEHAQEKKFFPDEMVWKSKTGPEEVIPYRIKGGRSRVSRGRTWVECEPPRKVLYKDAHKEGIRGGIVTTEYEIDEGAGVILDAQELELVIRALMSVRKFSNPQLYNGGNLPKYMAISILLGKLGVKAEEMD